MKVLGDLGQGDVDDAVVKGGHEGPQTDGEENQAPPGWRGGAGGVGHLNGIR